MAGKPRRSHIAVVSDDIPEAYLRRLLGDHDSTVFSRVDALRAPEFESRRKHRKRPNPFDVGEERGVLDHQQRVR